MPDDRWTTIGAVGQPWRAAVTAWGAVELRPDGGGPTSRRLDWYVAADDRWHEPASETTVRQRRVDGTPVVETRLRIPDGDAVQSVWAVPDHGGMVVVELTNESPLPIAVALAGASVSTTRPPSDVPIRGIDLPEGSTLLPVGHRATVRVALPVVRGRTVDPSAAPGSDAVARGWTITLDAASRLELPDPRLVSDVRAARADLLLAGPVDEREDPVGHLLDLGELVRLGEPAEAWMPLVARASERLGRDADPRADRALSAAARVAVAAEDGRAVDDIERLRSRRRRKVSVQPPPPASFAALQRGPSVGRFVTEVEGLLADGGALLPSGIPTGWRGADFEVHGIPTTPTSTVSFAVRWHGERPAVLWEQTGDPIALSAPGIDASWRSDEVTGEALWPAPRVRTNLTVRAEG